MNVQASKRVNGSTLSQYMGQSVTVVGEFMQLESSGRSFTMKTFSNDIVTVQLQDPLQDLTQGFVEVQGIVCPNNTIQCPEDLVIFPQGFCEKPDASLYLDVISLASRNPTRYITMA